MDSFFSEIMSLLNKSLSSGADIFSRFMTGKFLSLFLSVFAIIVVFRTIILPLIGSAGSDGVLNRKDEPSEDQLLQKEVARQDRSARASKYREVRDAFGGR